MHLHGFTFVDARGVIQNNHAVFYGAAVGGKLEGVRVRGGIIGPAARSPQSSFNHVGCRKSHNPLALIHRRGKVKAVISPPRVCL